MAAINFPTATSNGQTFTADTGVIYTYIGTPPNGFWSGTFGTTGLATLDGRFVALNDGNSIQTMLTQGLKFNNGSADTILLDGVNGKVGIGTSSPEEVVHIAAASETVNSRDGVMLQSTSSLAADAGLPLVFTSHVGSVANYGVASIAGRKENATSGNAAGYLQFATGSSGGAISERMRIDSSGNVGIGTTSPDFNCQITGTGTDLLKIQRSGAGGGAKFRIINGDSNYYDIFHDGAENLTFGYNGNERMRIDSSGNVGIGTTSPSFSNGSGFEIQRNGVSTLRLEDSSGNGAVVEIFADDGVKSAIYDSRGNSSNHGHEFRVNGSPKLSISSSGNVGIGTTSPQGKLHLAGSGAALYFEDTASSNTLSRIYKSGSSLLINSRHTSAGQIVFNSENSSGTLSERMRIDSSGSLLVGTSTTIATGFNQSGNIQVFDDTASIAIRRGADNQFGPTLALGKTRSTTDGSFSIVQSDDSFGAIRFAGADGTDFQTQGANIEAFVDGTPGANDMPGRLVFSTTSNGASLPTERLRIDSVGRLLLSTSTSRNVGANTEALFQLERSASKVSLSIVNNINSATGAIVSLAKSRSSGAGSTTIVQNNDQLGEIRFAAANGSNVETNAARISCFVNGTPGANDMPGRLEFSTTADGASSPIQRLQIDSNGVLISSHATIGGGIIGTNGNELRLQSDINANGGSSPFTSFYLGATERMRIDSSGRLLVGTSTAVTTGVGRAVQIAQDNLGSTLVLARNDVSIASGNTLGRIEFYGNDSNSTYESCAYVAAEADLQHATGDKPTRLVLATTADGASSPTERMRINSSGMVGVGTTVKYDSNGVTLAVKGAHPTTPVEIQQTTTNNHHAITFRNSNGLVGSINTQNSTTSYNTSSDYRLKENVVDLTAAIPRLKTLPVYRFNFIADSKTTVDGFLAHEAQLVVPEAVTGAHNEVDGDGNPVMQAIDQAKLVPLLTAALQEAIGRIETLESEVAALKAG